VFVTALHRLKSPQNVGMIVRSHVAFGGAQVLFVGYDRPWRFRKGSQAFSRKLERQCEIIFIEDDHALFVWCREQGYVPVAVEISPSAARVDRFRFPEHAALIVGNEATGLPDDLRNQCEHQVLVPQFGPVGSLNVAVACSIAQYEHAKQWGAALSPNDDAFPEQQEHEQ